MNIKMNHYLKQISYASTADESAFKFQGDNKMESVAKSGSNRDTVSISIEGQQFAAERRASDSKMDLITITSDLDSFRSAIKSMNEPLPVDWDKIVDPYNTFTNLAKVESRLKQLADPTASHKDESLKQRSSG